MNRSCPLKKYLDINFRLYYILVVTYITSLSLLLGMSSCQSTKMVMVPAYVSLKNYKYIIVKEDTTEGYYYVNGTYTVLKLKHVFYKEKIMSREIKLKDIKKAETIKKLISQSLNQIAIAKIFKVSRQAVSQYIKNHKIDYDPFNVKGNYKCMIKRSVEDVTALYKKFSNESQVAHALGVSRQAMYEFRLRHGIRYNIDNAKQKTYDTLYKKRNEKIIALYQAGVDIEKICTKFNMNKPAINYILLKHKVKLPVFHPSHDRNIEIFRLHEQGVEVKELAKKYKLDPQYISSMIFKIRKKVEDEKKGERKK